MIPVMRLGTPRLPLSEAKIRMIIAFFSPKYVSFQPVEFTANSNV
jgi:hypothetical protein